MKADKIRLIEDLNDGYSLVEDLTDRRRRSFTLMHNGKDVWRGWRWFDVRNARGTALSFLANANNVRADYERSQRREHKS
jgi:hypothetical protein